jgi:hypothetical protein
VMLKCHRKHPHLNSCANKIEVWDVFFPVVQIGFRLIQINFHTLFWVWQKKMDTSWYPQSWCLENRFVFFHVFVHVFFQKETGHFGGTPLGAPGRGTPSHLLLVAWWIWAMKIPLALSHLIILVAGWWWLEHWFSMG